MLSKKLESFDSSARDAAGEFMKIIFDQTKISLNAMGYHFDPVLPTITHGAGQTVAGTDNPIVFVTPIDSDAGAFFAWVSIPR